MAEIAQYLGTGKRKTSVARVILRPGDGTRGSTAARSRTTSRARLHRTMALSPLKVAGAEGTYDIRVRVHGGGPPARRVPSATVSPARSSRPTRSCACR